MDIHIEIAGDRQVGLRFEQFPDALYAELKSEIASLGEELLLRVEAATPSRTGRLRSEERVRVFADPTSIKAQVDIAGAKGSQDFAKAGALEYGAHRATKVSAHSMRLDHFWARRLSAPIDVLVSAYTRTPDIETFAFERGPLGEMQAEALARLEAVVEKAVGEANE